MKAAMHFLGHPSRRSRRITAVTQLRIVAVTRRRMAALTRRRIVVVLSAAALGAATLTACQSPSPLPTESSGPVVELATGLQSPWSMVALGDGHVLVSERDSGQIVDVAPDGTKQVVGTVPGVVHQGEGGLLGLAVHPGSCPGPELFDPNKPCFDLFAYLTTSADNRIVRMPLLGSAGSRTLSSATPIITGIPKGSNHNGGRIAFGPDGMLYAGTGDAGNRSNAQNPASLGGKILRMTRDGGMPTGNPFPNSPVWSLGHRNVQGLAWDENGSMWASEFGQNTWDELNRIQAGNNYGWPLVEGKGPGSGTGSGSDPQYTDPVLAWPTSEASPSGIAIAGTTLYMASLRGERLWQIELDGEPSAHARLTNQLGRLRDVVLTPDGRLLVLTNNTDGRGAPKDGDDRIVEITR